MILSQDLVLIVTSWFVVGQIFASVALQELSANDPYDFRVPIYTQVCQILVPTRPGLPQRISR